MVQITADYKEESLKDFLDPKSHRPERHAIRNLLGVLAFRRNQVKEAKDYFNKILEPGEDPDNLNAKANLDFVKRQTLSDEEYITSGVGIAASNLGPNTSPVTEKKRQGRRYAEQAFAFMFENYYETLTQGRFSTALELYNMAMTLAGDLVDPQEKDDWHLGIGLASRKIFKSQITTQDATKHLQTALSNFCALINSESADPDMRSDAFLHFGNALGEASRLEIDVNKEVPPNLVQFLSGPEICLKEALKYAVSDSSKASIYTRLATIRNRKPNHDFQGAMEYLSDSIRLDGSREQNYHAYSTRATICLKQFRFEQKNAGRRGGSPADLVKLLMTAKTDLEFILKEHVSPLDFFNLAEVYHHLATSSDRQSKEYIQQALETCSKGEKCQDGAVTANFHCVKGQCLCFIGQHRQALELFERGVECEEKTGWICGNVQLVHKEKKHLR